MCAICTYAYGVHAWTHNTPSYAAALQQKKNKAATVIATSPNSWYRGYHILPFWQDVKKLGFSLFPVLLDTLSERLPLRRATSLICSIWRAFLWKWTSMVVTQKGDLQKAIHDHSQTPLGKKLCPASQDAWRMLLLDSCGHTIYNIDKR